MSGGFGAQTPAITRTAAVFGAHADPILQQAERLQGVHGTARSTGRDYAAQGEAYRQAMTGAVAKLVRSFGERCISVSDRLRATAGGYQDADSSGSSRLSSAGGCEQAQP